LSDCAPRVAELDRGGKDAHGAKKLLAALQQALKVKKAIRDRLRADLAPCD